MTTQLTIQETIEKSGATNRVIMKADFENNTNVLVVQKNAPVSMVQITSENIVTFQMLHDTFNREAQQTSVTLQVGNWFVVENNGASPFYQVSANKKDELYDAHPDKAGVFVPKGKRVALRFEGAVSVLPPWMEGDAANSNADVNYVTFMLPNFDGSNLEEALAQVASPFGDLNVVAEEDFHKTFVIVG